MGKNRNKTQSDAGKMAQWLKAQYVLSGFPGSVPSTHKAAHNRQQIPNYWTSSSALVGHCAHVVQRHENNIESNIIYEYNYENLINIKLKGILARHFHNL